MAAFFGLFLHFFNFSDPVVLRDRAAEIDGVSLGIFGEIADIGFLPKPRANLRSKYSARTLTKMLQIRKGMEMTAMISENGLKFWTAESTKPSDTSEQVS